MKIEPPFDPLSITNRVKKRIEGRANGTVLTDISTAGTDLNDKTNAPTLLHEPSLKDEFMNLMMTGESTKDQQNALPAKKEANSLLHENIPGTNKLFLTQKECEQKKFDDETNQKNFSLDIESGSFGALKLSGTFNGTALQLKLGMQSKFSVQELSVLKKILESQLSATLNCAVELQIDRITDSSQQPDRTV